MAFMQVGMLEHSACSASFAFWITLCSLWCAGCIQGWWGSRTRTQRRVRARHWGSKHWQDMEESSSRAFSSLQPLWSTFGFSRGPSWRQGAGCGLHTIFNWSFFSVPNLGLLTEKFHSHFFAPFSNSKSTSHVSTTLRIMLLTFLQKSPNTGGKINDNRKLDSNVFKSCSHSLSESSWSPQWPLHSLSLKSIFC